MNKIKSFFQRIKIKKILEIIMFIIEIFIIILLLFLIIYVPIVRNRNSEAAYGFEMFSETIDETNDYAFQEMIAMDCFERNGVDITCGLRVSDKNIISSLYGLSFEYEFSNNIELVSIYTLLDNFGIIEKVNKVNLNNIYYKNDDIHFYDDYLLYFLLRSTDGSNIDIRISDINFSKVSNKTITHYPVKGIEKELVVQELDGDF